MFGFSWFDRSRALFHFMNRREGTLTQEELDAALQEYRRYFRDTEIDYVLVHTSAAPLDYHDMRMVVNEKVQPADVWVKGKV